MQKVSFKSKCDTEENKLQKKRRLELISSAIENVDNRAKHRCGPYIISDDDLHSDLDISGRNSI